MGTLSENQAQEHNEEKNRAGGEDLGAAAASKEDAHRGSGSGCSSEAPGGFGPVVWQQRCSGLSRGPAGRSLLPPTSGAHSPARSQQAGLVADCELVVFSFGFCFHVRLPLPVPPHPPPTWEPCSLPPP